MGLLIQQPAFASDGVFLPISSARKLAGDLDFFKKTTSNNANIIYNLKQQNDNLVNVTLKCAEKNKFLEQDKSIYKERGDKLEQVSLNCSNELQKCKEDSPSRLTWFTVGAISTLAVILTGMILIK